MEILKQSCAARVQQFHQDRRWSQSPFRGGLSSTRILVTRSVNDAKAGAREQATLAGWQLRVKVEGRGENQRWACMQGC